MILSLQDQEVASEEEAGWATLFQKRYRRIMLLAAGLPLLQQGSGINTVILYSSQVPISRHMHCPPAGGVGPVSIH